MEQARLELILRFANVMEVDNTTILYIVFAIIYFVFTNFIKKKKGTQNQPTSDRPEDATETLGPPPGRRSTFEELLEEFTTGQSTPQEAPITRAPERQEIEISTPSDDFVGKPKDKRYKKHSITKPEMSRFKGFVDKEDEQSEFTELLREPDGPRKAFVLSEIFKKKF